jgi:transposase
MEATGVYWIPIYEILESRGLDVLLVNARHVKNVPGRKSDVSDVSDVSDCEWLQELHSVGLLRGSFRPAAEIAALRSYVRHRETLIETAATSLNRLQKALVQMNVQLHVVISDISGMTGQRILRDIVNGQTDPQHLAKHRDDRCRSSEEEIAAALTGNYRLEHLFVLKQNIEQYDVLQLQIKACDMAIEAHLNALAVKASSPAPPLPKARTRRRKRSNEPQFDVRSPLHQMSGTDISQIDGIGPYNALRLISEIGVDMSRWPTESLRGSLCHPTTESPAGA